MDKKGSAPQGFPLLFIISSYMEIFLTPFLINFLSAAVPRVLL
ncbi:Hypothetical protein Minf_0143 [Methylacidiphilum infernorum V4]|uniref:Uncharacterized protein n=1 Tax=Methylacidiphilum infernorum (isolate V4) TaxID=481448 RepID=B3DX63_METI4|nr:Hypothetical protein Minf_0143 [Methylacidiphilum infernorum V4]